MKKAKQTMLIVAFCLLATEILLRITGVFRVNSERIGQGYVSNYGEVHSGWYNTHKANDTFTLPSADVSYPFITNTIGIRDKDYAYTKADSVYRILITGNSYVEGVGVPYDSTWPRLLEKDLQRRGIKVEVIDAGLVSNDIMFDYVLYRDKLAAFHPDLVIATMNNSDYVYYTFRGGMERFYADGTVHYLPAPWYDFIYHYSHLFRAILAACQFPVQGAYLTSCNYKAVASKATTDFAATIKSYKKTAQANNAKFIIAFYPNANDARVKNLFIINTLNNFLTLSQMLNSDSIANFNLIRPIRDKFRDRPKSYFMYPHDGHYKPVGNLLLAQLTADSLIASGIMNR